MITPTYDYTGIVSLAFDGLGEYTEDQLRAAIAAARRERTVADAYVRQGDALRELETLYQAMCARVVKQEQDYAAD